MGRIRCGCSAVVLVADNPHCITVAAKWITFFTNLIHMLRRKSAQIMRVIWPALWVHSLYVANTLQIYCRFSTFTSMGKSKFAINLQLFWNFLQKRSKIINCRIYILDITIFRLQNPQCQLLNKTAPKSALFGANFLQRIYLRIMLPTHLLFS